MILFNRSHLRIFFGFIIISSFISSSAHAAEVFYLSGAAASSAVVNPSYSLKQRFHDLFDFTSGRELNDRSGRITGNIAQEISWNNISGNTSKSFLRRGTDYLTELRLNIGAKLPKDYNFEGQIFLRKTDNNRIEQRGDVRMKQISTKIYNPKNIVEFADSYAEFSQFTLGTSLEGLSFETNPSEDQRYKGVIARAYGADVATEKFQRNIFGFKMDQNFFRDSSVFSNFRVGLQHVTTQDDSSTLERTSNSKQIRNHVTSIDGALSLQKYLSMNYEIARSEHAPDLEADKNSEEAYAVRLQPTLNMGKIQTRYLYNYVQPKFYTDVGSASPDMVQHQVTFDIALNASNTLSLTENYYWDHLRGSSLTKRTINDEKYVVWASRPFASRTSFSFRPYVNYQIRSSDDPGNTASGVTRTGGFSVNDTIGSASVGANYEYRAFTDKANRTASDYFHRVGLNFAKDYKLFGRRFYCSLDPALDLRSTKTSQKKDINFNLGLNATYEASQRFTIRLGNTLADSNRSKPGTDYFNNRTFSEFDYLINKKHATRFIVRAERNRYVHEDGNQTYNEQRVIAKFVSNF
ncbi:MAG TPA: hypothetical protein PKO44_03790 [Candidatus Omnitrophota bacterium]|nr:hypothetical protein [Candidatus Omnitrophota bacterium]